MVKHPVGNEERERALEKKELEIDTGKFIDLCHRDMLHTWKMQFFSLIKIIVECTRVIIVSQRALLVEENVDRDNTIQTLITS